MRHITALLISILVFILGCSNKPVVKRTCVLVHKVEIERLCAYDNTATHYMVECDKWKSDTLK